MNALEIDHISKKFGDFQAVEDLSLKIPAGTVYGLLGPNGAGKTTTIRMIMNILIPDSGAIHVLGRSLDDKMKERIGYLPEDRGLYPKMKVAETIRFLAEIKGVKPGSLASDLDAWLARFDLVPWKNKKIEELSKGMQQKVQFIVTVIHRPELIILDEPFSGMDPVNTKLFKDIMLEMKAQGCTIIFSTHRMDQVEMICDNICLINKSRMILEGNLAQIRQRYGKNTVDLEYEGDIGFLKGGPEVAAIDDYGKAAEIKLREGADPQALLARVVGRVRVNKFEVREPSLNSIFIELVGGSHV